MKQSSNDTLIANNFSIAFEKKYFNTVEFKSYLTTNDRADLLYGYLLNNKFNKNIVEVLCLEYNKPNSSNWLLERLERLFIENNNKKQEFLNIANENSIEIPEKLNDKLT